MDVPAPSDNPEACAGVGELLGRIGDKWTVRVIVCLSSQSRRFNELKREIDGISQQMLTRTVKLLEQDGLIERTVIATTPPHVSYALTPLGRSLSEPVRRLSEWAVSHRAAIRDNRLQYHAMLANHR